MLYAVVALAVICFLLAVLCMVLAWCFITQGIRSYSAEYWDDVDGVEDDDAEMGFEPPRNWTPEMDEE